MIIGLLGLIGNGKGTVSDILVEKYHFKKDSFASVLKDTCSHIFCWPRDMLEGDTIESREWREKVDVWWSDKLGIENFTPRLGLQLIGTDVLREHFHKNLWLLSLERRLQNNKNNDIVISDVRFRNEVDLILKSGGKLILVERGTRPVWWDVAERANFGDSEALCEMQTTHSGIHNSEWDWIGAKYTTILRNDGTLDDLHAKIKKLYDDIIR